MQSNLEAGKLKVDGHQWVYVGPGRAAGEMQHFSEPESTGNPRGINRIKSFSLLFPFVELANIKIT